ncbi:T9SS type A sorting domain-containing protein [Carboxylicivirga taeanensis]|uniref:T9SS type A sorting domain-containing protein n=1 Tax=Carboxylicivirga taeanensis TaxID=1416875 RepID=UPI003F6E390B
MNKAQLLVLTLFLFVNPIHSQVSEIEREALIALYNSTNGSNWKQNTNWNTMVPVSEWFGITVVEDHVTEIDLPNNLLEGSIPSEIGNITMLKSLNIWRNKLSGTIPPELGNCINLTELFLDENALTGQVPSSIANLTLMTNFWLDNNKLSGDITDLFSSWTNLIYFGIGGGNNFTGSLDLSNNSSLIACWVDNTNISFLNIKNGNNINIPNDSFKANNNPNLTCVIVDDIQFSASAWLNIDATSSFKSSTSECISTSIEGNQKLNVKVFPNPTSAILHIESYEDVKMIKVYNSLGKLVIESKTSDKINLSNYTSGIYFVKIIRTNNSSINFKIIRK